METIYQVQFKSNLDKEWRTFNMKTPYDVTPDLDKAKQTLKDAKEWHKKTKSGSERYEYRIVKISFIREVL